MTAAGQDIEISQGRRVFMGVIQYGLLGFSMYASFLHWYALVRANGQPKIESAFIAGCIDLCVYLATLYRQRDSRIGREPAWGFCTFPNVVLVAMIIVSVSGNVAEAKHTFGGYAVAVIPSVTFLVSLFLSERDAAESDRRRARQRAAAKAREEELEAQREASRQAQSARDEAERQARAEEREAGRRRQERQDRQAERQSRIAAAAAASSDGRQLRSVDGTQGKSLSAALRDAWLAEFRASGKDLTPKELAAKFGMDTSSLVRMTRLEAKAQAGREASGEEVARS
jgi:hypothetical protein